MITVFGSINLDLIFPLDRLPGPGETVLGPQVRLEPGGKGANQAVAAALAGAAVAMVGAVGTDSLADTALAGLQSAGVDLSGVRRAQGAATGCAAVCVDPAGRNLIAVGAGANGLVDADQVPDALLGPGNTLVLQMEVPAAQTAALIGRGQGARVVLNLAPALPLPLATLRCVDVLVVNEHEAAWLAESLGVACDEGALHAALGVTVVRTLGAEGVAFAGPTGQGREPGRSVTVVDTTAAGDCFTGVLAAALDRGAPLNDAVAQGNAAAAVCCTRAGSQASLPRGGEY